MYYLIGNYGDSSRTLTGRFVPNLFCKDIAQGNQVQKHRIWQSFNPHTHHPQRYGAGDGPGNQAGHDDDGIFDINGKLGFACPLFFIGLSHEIAAHDGSDGLVAEDPGSSSPCDHHSAKFSNPAHELFQSALNIAQHIRTAENPRIGTGQEHDSADLQHGNSSAAAQNGPQTAALGIIACRCVFEGFQKGKSLHAYGNSPSADNTGSHCDHHIDFKER